MGKKTMDDTEQTIFECTELGEYSGYVFLDTMQSGDKITIRIYVKDIEDDAYKKYMEEEYINALACPVVRIATIIGKVGFKVTARQTAGTYRQITYEWFKR